MEITFSDSVFQSFPFTPYDITSPTCCKLSACLHQALIDEDRLLSRLEVMGSQLQAYSKVIHTLMYLLIQIRNSPAINASKINENDHHNQSSALLSQSQTEEGIRKELLALQEDKHNYETTAKESLRRVLQEKIEVVRKLSEVEVRHIHTVCTLEAGGSFFWRNQIVFVVPVCLQRSLSNTEDECTHLKEMSERGQEELRELANKYNAAVNEIKDLTDKIKVPAQTLQYV